MKRNAKIGVFVLENLTTGMYTDPFDSIREYIQNAGDSILAAERNKLINSNDGLITISIDPEARSLSIRDNGCGIPADDVFDKLINIGMSKKVYGQEAGFRGIGRLAGMAYCKRLSFITSSPYEDTASLITFDCEGIRESFSPINKSQEEIQHVLSKYTEQEPLSAQKDSHYFEVRMEGIGHEIDAILDIEVLEQYLAQVAPVEYDSQSFIYAPKIIEWSKKNGYALNQVKVLIRTPGIERQVFKPYLNQYKTRRGNYIIDIADVEFYPKEPTSNTRFWMWYSKTNLLGMFDDNRVAVY